MYNYEQEAEEEKTKRELVAQKNKVLEDRIEALESSLSRAEACVDEEKQRLFDVRMEVGFFSRLNN